MDTYERIAMLEEAQGLVQEAIEKVEMALAGTHLKNRADAYQLARMKILADPDHQYLTLDEGIHHLIDDLKEAEREEREEHEPA